MQNLVISRCCISENGKEMYQEITFIIVYYVKVSGIPSGNKLIKTIRFRKSSGMFGNFRKFSENVRERSSGLPAGTILENLRKIVKNIVINKLI